MVKVLTSPSRYVQGKNVLAEIGKYVKPLGDKALVVISKGGYSRNGQMVEESFQEAGIEAVFEFFAGESSRDEVERLQKIVQEKGLNVSVGIGGGKALDTAKTVAHFESLPVAVCPTSAATDAPCTSFSVMYTEDGEFDEYVFFDRTSDLILMDTQVVANAPKRLFVAGMGDALATMFEARASVASGAKNLVGGLSTRAALGLTELCYEILMEEGRKALQAVEAGVLTEAVDQVIEASTYLSGVGAESSGLAAAHAVHNGMTALEETHDYLHGEKVAFGVITQLVLENAPQEELDEVLDFCMDIGLPVTLAELGVKEPDEAGLRNVAELAVAEGDTGHNEPFAVDADMYYAAIVAADKIGTDARAKRNA